MKQIAKTSEIVTRLKAAFGPDADTDNLAVFEAITLNNLPIRKKHPLYEGAVAQPSLLSDLVSMINTESQPAQIMHDGSTLPVGRWFDARLNGNEARALFAIPSDHALVDQIDKGIVDQVSVNIVPKKILCSKCSFDYLGEKATFEHIWTATCANDHKLRKDGTFARLEGLEFLAEISLVNKGGARNARIVGQSQSVYSAEPLQRLAASGHSPQLLLADITPTTEDTPTMDPAAFAAELTAAVTAKNTAEASVAALTGQVTTLTGERDTARTELAAAQTQVTELTTQVTDLTAKAEGVDKAVAALTTEATTILTACGKVDQVAALPKDVDGLLAVITEHRAQFAAAVPVGGKAKGSDASDVAPARTTNAYRSPRT